MGPNHSLRYDVLVSKHVQSGVRVCVVGVTCDNFVHQAQIEEFEKRLTAVHTRGLENVESPEMDEENQKEGASTQKTVVRTPLPAKGRLKTRRGQYSNLQPSSFLLPVGC